jgi:hypothetical protein
MRLPRVEHAVIEIAKLRDYCLDPGHPRGKHKARVFRNVFGMGCDNAEELKSLILEKVLDARCEESSADAFGVRYTVDFSLEREGQVGVIRTSWIVRTNEDFPRLTSCYVKR